MSNALKNVAYEKHSGFDPDLRAHIPTLPKRHMEILDVSISGEAPKDFIRVYEYGRTSRKSKPKTWTPYIAKCAEKWYPNESITEHLLNRLGFAFGVKVAASRLVVDEQFGRLRFLSEYFLRSGEKLEHGAEIFAGYLSADTGLVDEIEKDRKTVRDLFTFQFAEKAMQHRFGHSDECTKLTFDLVRMLCYDAITGNNDRHTYNWGIIRDLSGKRAPCFAPIYDTARGLLWNEHEENLARFQGKEGAAKLEKYLRESKPRIGWEGEKDPNHFELALLLYQTRPDFRFIFDEKLTPEHREAANALLEREFQKLFSPARYELIKTCLNLRIQKLTDIINQIKKEERT